MSATATAADTPEQEYVSISVKPRIKLWNLSWGTSFVLVGIAELGIGTINHVTAWVESISMALGVPVEQSSTALSRFNQEWFIYIGLGLIALGIQLVVRSSTIAWNTTDFAKDLNSKDVVVVPKLPREIRFDRGI